MNVSSMVLFTPFVTHHCAWGFISYSIWHSKFHADPVRWELAFELCFWKINCKSLNICDWKLKVQNITRNSPSCGYSIEFFFLSTFKLISFLFTYTNWHWFASWKTIIFTNENKRTEYLDFEFYWYNCSDMFAKMSGHITPKLLCNFKIGLFNISSFLLGSEADASVKPWSSNPILNIPYIFGRRVEGSEGTSALACQGKQLQWTFNEYGLQVLNESIAHQNCAIKPTYHKKAMNPLLDCQG